jgi:hypothetical protein
VQPADLCAGAGDFVAQPQPLGMRSRPCRDPAEMPGVGRTALIGLTGMRAPGEGLGGVDLLGEVPKVLISAES